MRKEKKRVWVRGDKTAVYSTSLSYFNLFPTRVEVTAERGFVRRSAPVEKHLSTFVSALFIELLIWFSCRKDDAIHGTKWGSIPT